jgi:glycosyltransferase involved in cell wall biosynthesis
MNLVMFSPAIRTSAIGRMAALVTRALAARGHEVTVVRTESENLLHTETYNFGTTVLPWNDSVRLAKIFQLSDTFIYQIGNSYEFHQGGLHWLERLPGLVCLHDFFLGHLFLGWAQSLRAEAETVLRSWYGDDAAARFFGFSNGNGFIEGTRDISPMTEWICSLGHGVITHSNWGCERVMNSCAGPVRVVPLAYNAPGASASKRIPVSTGESLQLLTVGHVNSNKRVESVIQAIGNSSFLKQRVVYRLVGLIQPETVNSLSALARKHGVRLLISGEVDDATLLRAIEESDVISCLRWPSLEAASASAIEAMLYGKPAIVTDTGFCSEIPDSYVLKISPDNELGDLKMILERLLFDKNLRAMVGAQGQLWASQTFTAENYAGEIIDMVEQTLRAKPSMEAVGYFCGILNRWSATPKSASLEQMIDLLGIFGNQSDLGKEAVSNLDGAVINLNQDV